MKIKSNKSLEPDISEVISKIKDFGGDRIKFIVLYGSAAKRRNMNLSDIDIAVFHSGDKRERFQFRMKILGIISNKFDIHIRICHYIFRMKYYQAEKSSISVIIQRFLTLS